MMGVRIHRNWRGGGEEGKRKNLLYFHFSPGKPLTIQLVHLLGRSLHVALPCMRESLCYSIWINHFSFGDQQSPVKSVVQIKWLLPQY